MVAFGCSGILNAQSTPTLAVDATSSQHAINPNIYGIANYGLDATYAQEIQVPNIRWGGDGATRYNWEVDSSNSGFDWYFIGGNGQSNPVPGATADLMINTYKPAHASPLITIPIIPYVNSTSEWNCSFPTSVYGAQQSTDPYVHPNGENCGNSISSSGTQLQDTDISANNIANSVALQQGWVEHLVDTFGTAAKGGVPFYQLDNEPGGWGNTHRDIEPNGATYNTIISLGQQYAAMIKEVDPSAMVLGPSDYTFGGWLGNPSQQNNLYAGQNYLQQMAAYNQAHGQRVLDYFDEHYYPEFTDPTSQLASTRTLWDPTYNGGTWVEQYYFDGPMQLIPRFQQWIAQYYPGTKLAFSEYSIDSGNKLITDALAEADVLGIFGRQQVDFANMWNAPAPTDPIAYAFRLYRNYDGQGSQFGNTSVLASSTNQGELSVYGALRSSDGALTLVVINKTTSAIQTSLSLPHFNPAPSAAVYSYSGANLTQITALGKVSITPTGFSYDFPGYSATVFVIAAGSSSTATPAFSPAGGTYSVAQTVTINDATPGAVLYYTTDGTVPGKSSPTLSPGGSIHVASTETIRAYALATGYGLSAEGWAMYTIAPTDAATPTFSIPGGYYTAAQTVTISDTTPGAKIYYTTDHTTADHLFASLQWHPDHHQHHREAAGDRRGHELLSLRRRPVRLLHLGSQASLQQTIGHLHRPADGLDHRYHPRSTDLLHDRWNDPKPLFAHPQPGRLHHSHLVGDHQDLRPGFRIQHQPGGRSHLRDCALIRNP